MSLFNINIYVETLFLKVTGECNFTIGMVYRPTNSGLDDFCTSLELILESLLTTSHVYIMGDFNIDLLRKRDNSVKDLINLLQSNSFFPIITKPTRVTH